MALLKGYRLRRGPALSLLITLGVVGSALILAGQLRPGVEVYDAVGVPGASVGATYAVDEQVCLRGAQVGAVVREVTVPDAGPLTVRVGLPPDDRPPVIAFPVDEDALRPLEGARVPARDVLCLRLLLSADEQGRFAAPEVEIGVRYGPLGLFRRTFDVTPPSTLEVELPEGRDPRLAG